ncbi:MAG TPA: DNA primase [Thermoanaerobaculia bacterium]|nr:DNA primase [Thermoanaerobaculia bacterium]
MTLGNVQLTPQLIQAVRDAVDITAIAGEHTRLRKAGRRYQGLCPIHKEKTPSFSVDPVQGLFYCFGCGAGGDAIKLHMLTTGDDFPAAIESLAGRHGIPLPSRGSRPGARPERDLDGALAAAAAFFAEQLRRSAAAARYLASRQVPAQLAERFGLGYAPDGWRGLIEALVPRVPLDDLLAAGLVGRAEKRDNEPYDRFRHRLIFPIHNAAARLVGFGGRALGDDPAKYVNTSETDRFHKGHLLYGLHLAKREIRESRRGVLVEGYFDVIATVACGREGVVAGMGTALTAEQAKLLARYCDEVVVAYDGDAAGETAFRRALPLLLAAGLGVRRAQLGPGQDPDSLRVAAGEAAVATALDGAEDAVELELRRSIPGTTAGAKIKAELATAIARLLEPIPDPILRGEYARRAAGMLGVSEKEFLSRWKELKSWRGVPPESPGGGAGRRLVRSDEEKVLQLLLNGEIKIPAPAELPAPEVFFDAECRNIYRSFCTLYAKSGGPPPEARAVLAGLGADEAAVDRMALILLEEPVDPAKAGLFPSLDNLVRRWRQQRLRQLVSEIAETQRRGDPARVASLLEEKINLSRSLQLGSKPGR